MDEPFVDFRNALHVQVHKVAVRWLVGFLISCKQRVDQVRRGSQIDRRLNQ